MRAAEKPYRFTVHPNGAARERSTTATLLAVRDAHGGATPAAPWGLNAPLGRQPQLVFRAERAR